MTIFIDILKHFKILKNEGSRCSLDSNHVLIFELNKGHPKIWIKLGLLENSLFFMSTVKRKICNSINLRY